MREIIVYHGLGYVGLTGAIHFAKTGVPVLGFDPSQDVVDAINAGRPKAGEFLGYLGSGVEGIFGKNFQATTHWGSVVDKKVHILAVPSEKDGEPFMDIVLLTTTLLADCVADGTLIVIESTLTPGTIDELLARNARLRSGKVLLAHAPRRDWFASPDKNLTNLPRVIGGVTEEATKAAFLLYHQVTIAGGEHLLTTDHRTAELVKPLENALFHAPIALAHALAIAYPNHDIAKAVELASTHWRFASFGGMYLGAGSGGRCVPLGPKYLANGASVVPDVLLAQMDVEEDISRAVASALSHRGVTGKVAVLGLAYRPGFADLGFSPALRLIEHIHPDEVYVHDTVADSRQWDAVFGKMGKTWRWAEWKHLDRYDAVVLITPHEDYLSLPFANTWRPGQVVIDARGAWSFYASKFEEFGVDYVQIGTPGWRG